MLNFRFLGLSLYTAPDISQTGASLVFSGGKLEDHFTKMKLVFVSR